MSPCLHATNYVCHDANRDPSGLPFSQPHVHCQITVTVTCHLSYISFGCCVHSSGETQPCIMQHLEKWLRAKISGKRSLKRGHVLRRSTLVQMTEHHPLIASLAMTWTRFAWGAIAESVRIKDCAKKDPRLSQEIKVFSVLETMWQSILGWKGLSD